MCETDSKFLRVLAQCINNIMQTKIEEIFSDNSLSFTTTTSTKTTTSTTTTTSAATTTTTTTSTSSINLRKEQMMMTTIRSDQLPSTINIFDDKNNEIMTTTGSSEGLTTTTNIFEDEEWIKPTLNSIEFTDFEQILQNSFMV